MERKFTLILLLDYLAFKPIPCEGINSVDVVLDSCIITHPVTGNSYSQPRDTGWGANTGL